MFLPNPFDYPTAPHIRVHGPTGYVEYTSYKPWLRDEFAFRCAYCLKRETWGSSASGHNDFGIDHVQSQATNPALVTDYFNLIYACNDCNSFKREISLPLNPLYSSLADHLRLAKSGELTGLTQDGKRFIDKLDLNSPGRCELRRDRMRIIEIKQTYPDDAKIDEIYRKAFGYPNILPDLTELRPPGGNSKAGSESHSHFSRRTRNELPDVY